MMKNIKIIKKLGSGMSGTVFFVESNGNNYALKMEKISDDKIEYNLKFHEWREIEFSLNFANNHPNHFLTLYEYDIIPNCMYEYTEDYRDHFNFLPDKVKTRLAAKEKGTHCIRKLYSLIDSNLKHAIKSFTKQQIYSTISQICCICYLLKNAGYSHNDFHNDNIGVLNTTDKFITLLNKKVKSFGIHIFAIDYGNVLHSKYNLNDDEKNIHENGLNNDILRFFTKLIIFEKNDQINKLIKSDDNSGIFDLFLKSKYYNLPIFENIDTDHDKFLLFQIIYPKKFQKMFFGKDYKITHKPYFLCDINDLVYFFKNKNNLKKLMKHFIKKTNKA